MITIILYIKNLFMKLLNFLFGKTGIFITILAWFLITTGVWFLFRPERARRKLVGMGFGPVKWILLIVCIYLVTILLSLSEKLSGNLALVLVIVIIISAVRFYFILKKKLYNKLAAWFSKIPMKHLKILAIIQIAVGCIMLALKRRIWF